MPDVVGVIGASSLVGGCVLSRLHQIKRGTIAFSRKRHMGVSSNTTKWQLISEQFAQRLDDECSIPNWICVAPIWALPEHFQMLESYGAGKIVALSSTSRFTKFQSTDREEQEIAKRLSDAEAQVQCWAEARGIEWVILRPTLIYGLGSDKNVTEIARLISRLGCLPLFGKAQGLRQPIHADDVAAACISALQVFKTANRAYNISGGETLTYRDMVTRIFLALDKPPRLLTVPLWMFRLAVTALRCIRRYRHWSIAMAERMNSDLVFDHSEAAHDFGFTPRGFVLTRKDLP